MITHMNKIAVIGAGSWGTTLAILLSEKGHDVKLWTRKEELAREINQSKENIKYLKGIKIPDNIEADTSLKNVLKDSELILSAVPAQFTRNVMKDIKPFYRDQIVISASKGIEHGTYKRMSEVIAEELDTRKVAAISGPNHAEEVSKKLPTASVVGCEDRKIGNKVSSVFTTESFKVFPLDDIIGVEVCGALKNITAIATGVCDGLGFGDNARASIITLGLTEMNSFGRLMKAKRETCYGLAGVGDLIATCASRHSRNRFVGEQLAKGRTMDQIKEDMHGMVAEGVYTTKSVYEFANTNGIKMPLTTQAYEVLFNNKNLKKAIKDLLYSV
jgi:glycerol-3-phosphate dehydrogenase (NAD(P)+)